MGFLISLLCCWIRVAQKRGIMSGNDRSMALVDPLHRKSTTGTSFLNRFSFGLGRNRRKSEKPESFDEIRGRCLRGFKPHLIVSYTLLASPQPGNADSSCLGPLGLNLLYAPSEPLIDFIFVHGLRGGSRKTWSKTKDVNHYWPQQWLPLEPSR